MQLKTKLAAGASAVVLAVGLGVALAGPAAAKDDQGLCVNAIKYGEMCGEQTTSSGQLEMLPDPGFNGYYLFDTPSGTGQINTLGSGCLEVVNSSGVVEAKPCAGAAAEEWTAEPSGDGAYYRNDHYALCLNDQYYNYVVNAAPCNNGRDELFYPSPSN
jgi:hypothetical protein